ncbi:hypothetical protein NAT51_03105 [Flavobacterium amniphilum]|uniref:hypothetical protein n=1 Tax=Flavobacterium amniphilum TaxID=1834035 RepID=UPI002029E66C|nr:hypothetical protein [Flavobacterium amniphilum]MCL9804493.1 hypothetical protein [Flavobacterium amniphilum]
MPMSNITSEDYIKGIKAKYEVEKKGIYTDFLLEASPALLRDLCLILYDNGLTKNDETIFKIYFKTNSSEELRNIIYNYHIPRFKAIQNFLKSTEENKTSKQNLNLIAVLLDFEPRPLARFLERNGQLPEEDKTQGIITSNPSNEKELQKKETPQSLVSLQNNLLIQNHETRFRVNKKVIIIGLLTLCIIIFLFAYNLTAHKDCLEWKNDRYVEVDCKTETNGFVNLDSKIPYSENLLQIRKIIPTDTTTYFKNGKAIIWYCKNGKENIELFNTPGHHPVNGKPLHCITEYMINKYLKK